MADIRAYARGSATPSFAGAALVLCFILAACGVVRAAEPADNAKALFDRGVAAWAENSPVEAHDALLAALAALDADGGGLRPRDVEALKNALGKVYDDWDAMDAVKLDAGLEKDDALLSDLIRNRPDDAELRGMRGLVRQKQYRLRDALSDLVAAQALHLRDMDLRAAVQKARVELERFDIVAKDDGHDPDREFAYYNISETILALEKKSDWDGLDRYLESLLTRPFARPYALVMQGYLAVSRGDPARADERFAAALAEAPDDAAVRADVSRGAAESGRLHSRENAAAEPHPETPLDVVAGDPLLMINMPVAPWFHTSAKLRLAERLMGRRAFPALDIVLAQLDAMPMNDAETGRYLLCLGESEWAKGRNDEAMEAFSSAVEKPVKDSRRAHALFRFARQSAREGDREKALEYAQQSIDLTAGYEWAQIRVGSLFIDLGEYDRGLSHLNEALRMASSPERKCAAAAALAEAYNTMERPEEYIEWARKYIEYADAAGPGAPSRLKGTAEYYRAEILLAQDDAGAVYPHYERAAALVTDSHMLARIHMFLAEADARNGENDKAAAHARLSAASLPDQRWKLRQVGAFLIRLGMLEEGAEYTGRALAMTSSTREKLEGLRDLAERFDRRGDDERFLRYAREYVDALEAGDGDVTAEERGMGASYRGDILAADGDATGALAAYGRAAELLTDTDALSDVYMNMAECAAALDDGESVIRHARRAVALAPQRPGRRRWAGALIGRFDPSAPEAPRAARAPSDEPGRRTPARDGSLRSYAERADAADRDGDHAEYLRCARLYVEAAEEAENLLPEERGLADFFRGELHYAAHEDEKAYAAFESAVRVMTDKYRLADALMWMAEFNAGRGETDLAVEQAGRSAALLPDKVWKLREAGTFLLGLDRPDEAERQFEKAIAAASSPKDRAAMYAVLADAFEERGETEKFLKYGTLYADTVAGGGFSPTRGEEGLAAYYRGEAHAAAGEDALALEAFGRAAELLENRRRLADVHGRMAKHLAESDPYGAYAHYERATKLITSPSRLAEALYGMARLQAEHGDAALAAELMERSVAQLPEQPWKLRQAADLFSTLDMPAKAVEYYEKLLAVAVKPADVAAAHLGLAELFRRDGEEERYLRHAGLYLEALSAPGRALTDEERGLSHFYRGEILLAERNPDAAFVEYALAVELLRNATRRADLYLKLADFALERGEADAAIHYAEQSVALFPDRSRRHREAGAFFGRMKASDREFEHYRLALVLATSPTEKAAAYSAIADFHKTHDRQEEYLRFADAYICVIEEMGDAAKNEDRGLSAFYTGEILSARGLDKHAYTAYSTSAALMTDKYRRSEAFLKMARHSADAGDATRARDEALESARLLPDRSWRAAGVASLLSGIGEYWAAAEVLSTAIRLNPEGNALLHRNLAEVYARGIDRRTGMRTNVVYMDHLYATLAESADPAAADKVSADLWAARQRQAGWAKSWGKFESRLFGSRDEDGDYYLAVNNELYFNTRFPNGFRGKIYGELGWTLNSRHTGYSLSAGSGVWRPWESTPGFSDTLRATVGFRFNPFPKVAGLDFRAEYVFGIGREEESDFRLKLKFDRSEGLSPRRTDSFWMYKKEEADLVYSTRNNDFTSVGTFRRGLAYSPASDRNFVIAPYWALRYSYAGKEEDKGDRWAWQTGPGLAMRKYFLDDKYHTALAYVELNLHYRIGLTQGRQNSLGFSLTTAF